MLGANAFQKTRELIASVQPLHQQPHLVQIVSPTESFDLFNAMRRGLNAHENELLALANPDGNGTVLPINRPHR